MITMSDVIGNSNIFLSLLCGVVFLFLGIERIIYCIKSRICNILFTSKILLFLFMFLYFICVFHINLGIYAVFFNYLLIASEIGVGVTGAINLIKYLDYRNFPKFICFKKTNREP